MDIIHGLSDFFIFKRTRQLYTTSKIKRQLITQNKKWKWRQLHRTKLGRSSPGEGGGAERGINAEYYSWQWWKRKKPCSQKLNTVTSLSELLKMHALLNWAIALSNVRTLFFWQFAIALHSFSFTQKSKITHRFWAFASIYKAMCPALAIGQ